MEIRNELIELLLHVNEVVDVPAVSRIFMPEPTPSPDRDSEFGIVVLEDGSAGLYYAWMGEAQKGMNQRYHVDDFIGSSPLDMLRLYQGQHEADRSLGMAAINAISQSVFRQAGLSLANAEGSMGALEITDDDHVGMVGYFPSLVRRLTEKGIRVTVIEKKKHLLHQGTKLVMTADPAALQSCTKVMSTASTLLNDTLDEILSCCGNASLVNLIGPTAGFLPDPLFHRGVSAIGGSQIVDVELAIRNISEKKGLGPAARKYLLKREDYPGFAGLFSGH